MRRYMANRRKLSQQFRQGELHRVPDYLKIDHEVAVCNPVSHALHAPLRYLRMLGQESALLLEKLAGRFTDDDQVQDGRLLGTLIREKVRLAQPADVGTSDSTPQAFSATGGRSRIWPAAIHPGR